MTTMFGLIAVVVGSVLGRPYKERSTVERTVKEVEYSRASGANIVEYSCASGANIVGTVAPPVLIFTIF